MQFNVVVGNPMLTKHTDGTYQVIYAEPINGKIKNYENLTYQEALELPFVKKEDLKYLK